MKKKKKWHALREYRRKHEMSAQEFATKMGVSMMTVYRWENGKTKPHRFLLDRINRILQKSGD